jgi:hypothetical protein
MSGGLHHEHCEVTARSGAQSERLAGKLDPGFLAANILEGFINMRVQLIQEFGGIDELTGLVKVQEPALERRTVMRIAGETVLDNLHLLVCSVLEGVGIGAGVDEAFDGLIIIKVYVHLTQETQFTPALGEGENGNGVSIDIA